VSYIERENIMDEKNSGKKQVSVISEKKTYIPPTLTVYGKLTELTASGTNPGMENSSSVEDKLKTHA
jgi:hypothetical protein